MTKNQLIKELRQEGLIITSPKTIAQLVRNERRKLDAKDVDIDTACGILELSKTAFKALIKSPQTLLRKTKSGGRGRGNAAMYLTASVMAEKKRLKLQ